MPRILPSALLEMRQWAGEQRPDVRERVLRLCDALEDCADAAESAGECIKDALLYLSEKPR